MAKKYINLEYTPMIHQKFCLPELLDYINSVINITFKFICNSCSRRFGKAITADMMTAYYSKGCNSEEMGCRIEKV